MYAREIPGQPEPLTFGVSGKLIMNVLVMYDRETDTLWSQILGRAVQGPLAGTQLEPLPALQTTWVQWRQLHPDTLALDKGSRGFGDPYLDYYESNRAGVLGETRRDDRVQRKELGLGMVIEGQPAYYPFGRLAEERVVNDQVAGQPLVVVFQPTGRTAAAYLRRVDGQELTFDLAAEEPTGPILVDGETGSRWSGWTGAAIDGPLAGKVLARVPATTSFWFGWKDWHPDTHVYP